MSLGEENIHITSELVDLGSYFNFCSVLFLCGACIFCFIIV